MISRGSPGLLRKHVYAEMSEGAEGADAGTNWKRIESEDFDGMPEDDPADDLKSVFKGGTGERAHAFGAFTRK